MFYDRIHEKNSKSHFLCTELNFSHLSFVFEWICAIHNRYLWPSWTDINLTGTKIRDSFNSGMKIRNSFKWVKRQFPWLTLDSALTSLCLKPGQTSQIISLKRSTFFYSKKLGVCTLPLAARLLAGGPLGSSLDFVLQALRTQDKVIFPSGLKTCY